MNARDDHEALLNATVRLVREADAPARIHENAQLFFDSAGLTPEHAETWAQAPSKRILLYRKLVRNGFRIAIRKLIPLTAARLGPNLEVWLDKYCQEELPVSHYLRDVALEFVAWVVPQWEKDPTIPRYMSDLARFELFEFQIAIAENVTRNVAGNELLLDHGVLFDPSVRLDHFEYAVQRLADDESDREEPEQEAVTLLGYRDSDYEVHCLELNPLAAGIIQRLLFGKTLKESVVEAFGGPVPPEVLQSISELLANLAEQRVILGAS